MQKKAIALAVAGLASGIAVAQSNVTIYGVADMNYTYANHSYNDNSKSLSAIQSGGQSGSRVGFKGTEELGNGLYAAFRLEMGLSADTGVSTQTGTFGRWSTVTLGSKQFGEIELGRRDTFHDQLVGGASANGRTTIAQVSPVYIDQARIGNFAAYLSPIWNGLQLKAGFSTAGNDAATQEVEPTQITAAGQNTAANTNNRLWTVAAHYNNGPLLLGASYERNKLQSRSSTVAGVDSSYDAGNVWNIAGAYDFGVVRLDAAYGEYNYAENVFASGSETKDKRKQWTVGLAAPIGASGKLTLVYAKAKLDYINAATDDDKLSMWGLAYFHDLSKRTNLYAAYGKISQDDDNITKASLSTLPSGTGYEQGMQVGIRHRF